MSIEIFKGRVYLVHPGVDERHRGVAERHHGAGFDEAVAVFGDEVVEEFLPDGLAALVFVDVFAEISRDLPAAEHFCGVRIRGIS